MKKTKRVSKYEIHDGNGRKVGGLFRRVSTHHSFDAKRDGEDSNFTFKIGNPEKTQETQSNWDVKRLTDLIALGKQLLKDKGVAVTQHRFKKVENPCGDNFEHYELRDKKGTVIKSTIYYGYDKEIGEGSPEEHLNNMVFHAQRCLNHLEKGEDIHAAVYDAQMSESCYWTAFIQDNLELPALLHPKGKNENRDNKIRKYSKGGLEKTHLQERYGLTTKHLRNISNKNKRQTHITETDLD